jgi:hypothetical protein
MKIKHIALFVLFVACCTACSKDPAQQLAGTTWHFVAWMPGELVEAEMAQLDSVTLMIQAQDPDTLEGGAEAIQMQLAQLDMARNQFSAMISASIDNGHSLVFGTDSTATFKTGQTDPVYAWKHPQLISPEKRRVLDLADISADSLTLVWKEDDKVVLTYRLAKGAPIAKPAPAPNE